MFLNMRRAVLFPESYERQRGALRNMTSVEGPSALRWEILTGEDEEFET